MIAQNTGDSSMIPENTGDSSSGTGVSVFESRSPGGVASSAIVMAFVDELLTHSPTERVILVDKHAKPGGHWNDAYPFVSLHQPAAYYGVNSEKLGSGGAALASGTEVLSYYERVMCKFGGWLRGSRLSLVHHESLFKLIWSAFNARKIMPVAMDKISAIMEKEFPGPRPQ